jgi:hypothetical protein
MLAPSYSKTSVSGHGCSESRWLSLSELELSAGTMPTSPAAELCFLSLSFFYCLSEGLSLCHARAEDQTACRVAIVPRLRGERQKQRRRLTMTVAAATTSTTDDDAKAVMRCSSATESLAERRGVRCRRRRRRRRRCRCARATDGPSSPRRTRQEKKVEKRRVEDRGQYEKAGRRRGARESV